MNADIIPNPLAEQLRQELEPILDRLCDGDCLSVDLCCGIGGELYEPFRTSTDEECQQMQVYFTVKDTFDARRDVVRQMRRFLQRVERELQHSQKRCRKARRTRKAQVTT